MKLTKSQKGFSAVEIIMVIVIVGLLGAVGWFVYDRQKNSKEQTNTTTQTEQTKMEPEESKSSMYKSDELGLSLNYPTEWGTASLADGPLSKYQSGKYKQLSFSKVANVSVNFVTDVYSSPLDGCGYGDPVQNAQHAQNAQQASVIGWESDNILSYVNVQGKGVQVYKTNIKPGDTGTGYTEISKSNKVLVYKDINNSPVEAGSGDGCNPVTQAQADEANAFANFFHYAVNFSNKQVKGVNGQFDARKSQDTTVQNQLTTVLNSIK